MCILRSFRLVSLTAIVFLSACAATTDQDAAPDATASGVQTPVVDQPVNDNPISGPVQVTTPPSVDVADTISPTAPGNLRLMGPARISVVNLTWDYSTDNVAVSGYRIFRDGVLLASITQNIFADDGVNENTAYQYLVEAFDAENNTASSGALNVMTPLAADNSAPSIPANLITTVTTSTQISFSWTASSDNIGVSGYRIYKNYSTVPHATVTTLSFTDTGLSATQTHVYSVSAIDAAGNESALSDVITIDTLAAVVTQPVVLSWQTPTQNTDDSCLDSIQGYNLHFGMTSGNYSSTVNLDLSAGQLSCVQTAFDNVCGLPVMTCSYTVDSLEAGTWYFAMQTIDATGIVSGYSNEASKLVN